MPARDRTRRFQRVASFSARRARARALSAASRVATRRVASSGASRGVLTRAIRECECGFDSIRFDSSAQRRARATRGARRAGIR